MEKPASTRQLKVAREIQKDLAEIIRAKGMAAFDGALVTVSEVRVSPDLSVAKVFVSIFPSAKQEKVMGLLEESNKALRGELGHLVAKQFRIVPELIFLLDTSLDYAEHIEELLKKVIPLPLRFAFRYLFARKSYNVINLISGIGVAGMAVGTAALITVLSVFNGFDALVSDSLAQAGATLVVRPAGGKVFIPEGPAFDWLEDNATSVSKVLEEQAFLSFEDHQSLARVKGIDMVSETENPLQQHIVAGRWQLHRGDLPQAVGGAVLSHNLGAHPQFVTPLEIHYPSRTGTISLANPAASLRSKRVQLAGTFSINAELDAKLLIVPIEVMRELLDYDKEVSALEIECNPALKKELQERLGPSFRVLDLKEQNESVYRMMRYEKLAIYLILVFIVALVAFNIYSSLRMLIIEKEPDMETLRSLGAPEALLRRIFLLEGVLVSLLGMVIGLLIGITAVVLQQRFGFVPMPGNFAVTSYPVALKATDILYTVLGVSFVGLVMAFIPSRKLN